MYQSDPMAVKLTENKKALQINSAGLECYMELQKNLVVFHVILDFPIGY